MARRCRPSARRAAPTCSSTRCSSPISATTAQRDYLRGRGDDPDRLLHVYADLVNAACAGRTPGMTISMHLCRGNFRSTWMAQGGYERGRRHPVQPDGRRRLLHGVRQRARRRLRAAALPAQGQAGRARRHDVQDRRAGEQGPAQAPHRRGCEVRLARPALPLARNAASPRTEEGNLLAEDEQWAKLSRCVEVAEEVWG